MRGETLRSQEDYSNWNLGSGRSLHTDHYDDLGKCVEAFTRGRAQ